MAFDNDYPNRKDWRKPYKYSKSFDRTCRNHGSCGWCEGNRRHTHKIRAKVADEAIREYFTEVVNDDNV